MVSIAKKEKSGNEMKNSQKIIAGVLSGILLSTSLIIPTANAQSNRSIQNEIQRE